MQFQKIYFAEASLVYMTALLQELPMFPLLKIRYYDVSLKLVAVTYDKDRHEIRKGVELFSTN